MPCSPIPTPSAHAKPNTTPPENIEKTQAERDIKPIMMDDGICGKYIDIPKSELDQEEDRTLFGRTITIKERIEDTIHIFTEEYLTLKEQLIREYITSESHDINIAVYTDRLSRNNGSEKASAGLEFS